MTFAKIPFLYQLPKKDTITMLRIFLLSLFLLSTPICAFFVFYLEDDRTLFYGTINSYAFSIAMILLYFR